MSTTSEFSKTIPKSAFSTPALLSIWPVLALATILRFVQIGAEGVWLDEMYSLEDASELASGNLGLRPFFYLLLRGWMLFGGNDIVLRSLSVVLDLGAIYLAYRLCFFTLGRSASLVTALMMSLSPILINHAQEIRMYPLISCLTLAGSLAMAHSLANPTLKSIGIWSISRLLAILTSPLMLVMLFPDGVLFGLAYWLKWPQWRKFLYGLLFIGAAWAPFVVPQLFKAVPSYIEDQGAPFNIGITNVLSRLTQFTVFWPLNSITDVNRSLVPLSFYKLFTLVLLLTLVIGLTAVRLNLKSRPLWIAAWALLPMTAQIIASETVMEGTIWKPRYLLYMSPYFIMLIALGFDRIRKWKPSLAIATSLLYFLAVCSGLHFYYLKDYRPPWQDISAKIEAQEQTGDVVINYTWMGNQNFPRYYEGESELITLHLPRRQTQEERLEMVLEATRSLPQGERVWLVCQENCQEQEEFELITEAVVGPDPQAVAFEEFPNIVGEESGLGNIELHMLTDSD